MIIMAAKNGMPSSRDVKAIKVVVKEVNSPPELDPVPDQAVIAGSILSLTNRATDADLLVNTLSFNLLQGPAGAQLEARTGVFTWRPGPDQVGTNYSVTVQVTDNGIPSLSAAQTFRIHVDQPPEVRLIALNQTNGQFALKVLGSLAGPCTFEYSTNLINPTNWLYLFSTNVTTAPLILIDTQAIDRQRFYRVRWR